jgi:hypothetical protein
MAILPLSVKKKNSNLKNLKESLKELDKILEDCEHFSYKREGSPIDRLTQPQKISNNEGIGNSKRYSLIERELDNDLDQLKAKMSKLFHKGGISKVD